MDSNTVHVRPFADWLREQSNGRTHDELTEALAALAASVRETGKKGTLTLAVTIAPFDKGQSHALVVTDSVKVALPQHDRRKTVFFANEAGNLTKDDPQQPTFEGLREVPAPALAEAVELPQRSARA